MGQWTPAGFDPAASATVGPIPIRGGVLGDARVASILPSQGHHQGNTSVSIFGSGFLFNSSEIRCCWDHHPGYLSSQVIKDGRVLGGDGVADEQTVPTHVSDTLLVCPSYVSIPGYTHTDDLLLAFGHTSCNASQLLDTELDFQFYLNTLDMQVRAVEPRGGPVGGGTRVRFVGLNFGGQRLRCRVWVLRGGRHLRRHKSRDLRLTAREAASLGRSAGRLQTARRARAMHTPPHSVPQYHLTRPLTACRLRPTARCTRRRR